MSGERTGIWVLLLVLVLVFAFNNVIFAFSGKGSGTETDPYQITDWAELNEVRNDLVAHYKLMGDLSSSTDGYKEYVDTADGWDPIGYRTYEVGTEFTGTIDGQGHVIKNLYIDRDGLPGYYVGLIGYTSGATIKNLKLENLDITGDRNVGGLIGRAFDTEVSNCYSSGTVQGSYDGQPGNDGGTGGLIGNALGGSVENSDTAGAVSGTDVVGGLIGFNRARVENCHSDAAVGTEGSTGDYIGGLIGANGYREYYANDHTVKGSHSTGKVQGSSRVGGLIGYNSSTSLVSNCHSTSTVDANGNKVGGLIGYIYQAEEIEGCYHTDGSVSGGSIVGGFAGHVDTANIIKNSYSKEDVTATGNEAGGFIGRHARGSIKNCYSEGTVEGVQHIGGFIGYSRKNRYEVSSAYSKGNATGENNVGGFIGYIDDAPVLIKNSYSTGDAVRKSGGGGENFGGFCGRNLEDNTSGGEIQNSYSTGSVIYATGNTTGKGFVGANDGGSYQNNFFDKTVSNQNTDVSGAASGKTTREMKDISTFDDANWAIKPVEAEEDSYPYLAWEEGKEGTWLKKRYIAKPVADFTYSPETPTVNDTIQFTDRSSGVGGEIIKWDWEFGDDVTSTDQNPIHSYNEPGIYTVKLTVTDDDEESSSTFQDVTVGVKTKAGEGVEVNFDSATYRCGKLESLSLTYEEVTASGQTAVTPHEKLPFDSPGEIKFLGCFYEPTTTAKYSGDITLKIRYDDSGLTVGQQKNLRQFKLSGDDTYVNLTDTSNIVDNYVRGKTDSLSYFGLGYGVGTIPEGGVVNHGPNPAGKEGAIFWFDLPDGSSGGRLTVYGVDGRPLLRVNINETQSRYPEVGRWNLKDANGNILGNGIYLYMLTYEVDGSTARSRVGKLVIDRSN